MKLFLSFAILSSALLPSTAGAQQAPNALAPLAERFSELPPPTPVPAPAAIPLYTASWTESVKAAVDRELDLGGLIGFAEPGELPANARRCLEHEWEILPEGPGNSSESFKLDVNGRTAFIIQSYIYSDEMRLYVFDEAGNFIAYGDGTADTEFAWKNLQTRGPWAEAAKAAAEREMDLGGFIGFADLKELPPGARRCLEREWEILPEGPGNSSEAFKLNVNGRTAFIVQSYIYSDEMRLFIFDAAGNPVAYGEGSAYTDFAWLPLPR